MLTLFHATVFAPVETQPTPLFGDVMLYPCTRALRVRRARRRGRGVMRRGSMVLDFVTVWLSD